MQTAKPFLYLEGRSKTKTGSSNLLDTVATLLSFRGSPYVRLEHVDWKKNLANFFYLVWLFFLSGFLINDISDNWHYVINEALYNQVSNVSMFIVRIQHTVFKQFLNRFTFFA